MAMLTLKPKPPFYHDVTPRRTRANLPRADWPDKKGRAVNVALGIRAGAHSGRRARERSASMLIIG